VNEYALRAAAQDAYNKQTVRLLKSAMGPAIGVVPAASVVPHVSDSDEARLAQLAANTGDSEFPPADFLTLRRDGLNRNTPSLYMFDAAKSDYTTADAQYRHAVNMGMPPEAQQVYQDRAVDRAKTLSAVTNAARKDVRDRSKDIANNFEKNRPQSAVEEGLSTAAINSFPLSTMTIGPTVRNPQTYGPITAAVRGAVAAGGELTRANPYISSSESGSLTDLRQRLSGNLDGTLRVSSVPNKLVNDEEMFRTLSTYRKPTYNGGPVPGPAGMLMRDAQSTAAKNIPSVFQPPSPVMTAAPAPAAPAAQKTPATPAAPAAPSAPK